MKNITIFDKTTSLGEFSNQIEKILKILQDFGLSKNESKMYTFLGKHGTKTASEIKTALNIPHSDVYRFLNKLQRNGILHVSYGSAMIYSIIPPKNLLISFIEEEKNKIKILEKKEKIFLELWNKIPNFIDEDKKTTDSIFLNLNGDVQINNKLKEMIRGSKKEFLLLGSQKDFAKFYHGGIFDLLKKSKINQKLLGTKLEGLKEVFKLMHKKNIQIISSDEQNKLCFAIDDGCSVLFFTKQTTNKKPTAIFTNSQSILDSLSMLFDFMWSHNQESKKESVRNKKINDSEFKLKELKQVIIINNELNQYLKKEIQNKK